MEITVKLNDEFILEVAKELGFNDLTNTIEMNKSDLKKLKDEAPIKSLTQAIKIMESQNDPLVYIKDYIQGKVDAAMVNVITTQEREKLEGVTKQAVEARLLALK